MAPFVMGRTWVCAQGVAFLDVAVSIQKSVADGLAYFRAPGGESPSIGEDVERSLESGEKSGSDVALRVHRNIPGLAKQTLLKKSPLQGLSHSLERAFDTTI